MALVERSTLTGAKDEYAERLVQILCPQMVSGIRDIFNEAVQVCADSGEPYKYLMTFQNFLAKVPTWSSATVEEETTRIIADSGCSYMAELVACVHVAHLKLLTSIRPSETSREVELPMPALSAFIHKAYVVAARKLWKSTFLFETGIMPLDQQKNAREIENVIRGSIVDAIRESLPVDDILKNYLRGVEETVEAPVAVSAPSVLNEVESSPEEIALEVDSKIAPAIESAAPVVTVKEAVSPVAVVETPKVLEAEANSPISKIAFTNTDQVLDMGTNATMAVPAPKDITTLETKTEPLHGAPLPPEDDDESLTISSGVVNNALAGLVEEL